jgi:hypothetical protein
MDYNYNNNNNNNNNNNTTTTTTTTTTNKIPYPGMCRAPSAPAWDTIRWEEAAPHSENGEMQ